MTVAGNAHRRSGTPLYRLRELRKSKICGKLTVGLDEPECEQGARSNGEHARGMAKINGLMIPPQAGCYAVRRSLDVGQVIGRASSHRQVQWRWGHLRCGAYNVLTDALTRENRYEDAKTQSGL
jgi:hypothetical protein